MNDTEAKVIAAARAYRDAAKNAEQVWMANGRRGASQQAVDRVNWSRQMAKDAHQRLMDAVDQLEKEAQS